MSTQPPSSPLLAVKRTVPQLRAGHVSRGRLLDLLDEPTRLALVVAPAGWSQTIDQAPWLDFTVPGVLGCWVWAKAEKGSAAATSPMAASRERRDRPMKTSRYESTGLFLKRARANEKPLPLHSPGMRQKSGAEKRLYAPSSRRWRCSIRAFRDIEWGLAGRAGGERPHR